MAKATEARREDRADTQLDYNLTDTESARPFKLASIWRLNYQVSYVKWVFWEFRNTTTEQKNDGTYNFIKHTKAPEQTASLRQLVSHNNGTPRTSKPTQTQQL
eukprot:2658249-Amphidinium_carterae.5